MLPLLLAAALYPPFAATIAISLLAQTSDGAAALTPYATLFSSGVSGIFLYLFATDKIGPTGERNRLREEMDRRNAQDRDTLIPLLTRVLDALARATEQQADRKGRQ